MQHERVIYESDNGESIIIAYFFPYFLRGLSGQDGTKANITRVTGAGQDGSTITNVVLADRDLQLKGGIKGNSKDEVEKYRLKLLRTFSPKSLGWLQYEYGNLKRRIRCQVETAPVFAKISTSYRYQDFLVDFICANPYWQDLASVKSEIAIWRGSFEFPLELVEEGIEIGFREPSLIVNVFNSGDVACGMKIQFKALATVENPSLFNVNTREEIKINKVMEAGEIITVTTHFQNKRVVLDQNGVKSNAFMYLDLSSTFMQLEPGDNLLRYDADDGIDNLEVSIWHTPQYLGV
ncbi:Phage-like protein [Desulfitobacterium hafniense]|uniref:Phage-like protein n=1 Tax=Desulfitobacterium hafniense TaxID=49338 RepID=A0A098AVZ5_DESHA|nr:phage tail family protein [Desulfitobacterium hafniense]CDV96347.1 Phage-like protein [Desulfitobacterium hafniense]